MVKEKLILAGTDNNGFRHRYSFDKTKSFKKEFIKLMKELDFDEAEISKKFIKRTYEEDEEKIYILSAFDLEDICWFFSNKKFEVDVFFGKDKVIVLVRTRARREMLDELEKKSEWISEQEKEKRLKKNKQLGKKKIEARVK